MTLFDWFVVGFIPIAIALILVNLVLHDWSWEELMFKKG